MPNIEVYTSDYCPYCTHAKALLQRKGAAYKEINVGSDHEARLALVKKANGLRTVPQIFINGQHIGGFDALSKLDQDGKLDPLLQD